MGVLDRFEKGIERAVNGVFARAFRSEVQPVELASALKREADDNASVVGRNRTIAPNEYVVELGPADHGRLAQWEDALGDELATVLNDHALQQRYAFVGPVRVRFERAEELDTGVFRVRSRTARSGGDQAEHAQAGQAQAGQAQVGHAEAYPGGPNQAGPYPADQYPSDPYQGQGYAPAASPASAYPPGYGGPGEPAHGYPAAVYPPAGPYPATGYPPPAASPWAGSAPSYPSGGSPQRAPTVPPVLEVDGRHIPLVKAVTVIGRAGDVDVPLDDAGVSRRHAEIHLEDGRARVVDLGSTNGTFVDGERVGAGELRDGSTIAVGRSRLVFRLGPR